MVITDYKQIERMFKKLNTYSKRKEEKFKFIKVGTAKWTNINTKQEQRVDKVYFYAFRSSCRPWIVNQIKITNVETNESTVYRINDMYTLVNILNDTYTNTYTIYGDGKSLPKVGELVISGQEFCNPLSANHLFEGDEKDMAGLLKVTLMSQNVDDGYGSNPSVQNGYIDYCVRVENGYKMFPDRNTALELLLAKTTHELRNLPPNTFNAKLRELVDIPEDCLYAKPLRETKYMLVNAQFYKDHKADYSSYYPVFTYKAIQNMNIKIPRDHYELGVYGLGSAGTAILDQTARSNWLESIYLCDFDRVEAKNLINQWYTNDDISIEKATASKWKLEKYERAIKGGQETKFYIDVSNAKFQDTKLDTKEFKYVVSGFDSIEVRQEFFNNILDGKIKAKYLIDCRYLDLACSVYFIDLDNTEEVEFYKANLEADAELIKAKKDEVLTFEEFDGWVARKDYYARKCIELRMDILSSTTIGCCPSHVCASEECKKHLYDLYLKSLPNSKIKKSDASCIKYNYIDIYKYVGAIVFGAMRRIENGQPKPFSLVEAETDVKGLPNYMVVKE